MDKSYSSRCSILVGLLALFVTAGAQAQSGGWSQDQKFLASDGAAPDEFGLSVSLSADGSAALVGSRLNDAIGIDSGAAYVYRRDPVTGSFTEETKLLASDAAADHFFGASVSLSSDGNAALVGAYSSVGVAGVLQGSAYVFTRDPTTGLWAEEAKLLASDGAANDSFGYSVSLSSDGNAALVGAWQDDDNGADSGSAYVYVRDPVTAIWTEEAKLVAPDGGAFDGFGRSASLSPDGTTALIGAPYDDDNFLNSGSAYVFAIDPVTGAWAAEAKLLAPDPAEADDFGAAISLSSDGGTALIGAQNDDDNGFYTGSAYVFTRNSLTRVWTPELKLLASDGATDEFFGSSVSLSSDGTVALIGARAALGTSAGSAYVYTRNAKGGWAEVKLLASDGVDNDRFGDAVSLSSDGTVALVGASRDDDNGPDSGSAYLFTGTPPLTVPAVAWVGLLASLLTGTGWLAIRRT